MNKRIKMKVEKEGPEPLYLQIQKQLFHLINSKKLKPGQRVPSEDMLSDVCKVSRMTARQALTDLQRKGLIYRIPGKGTFVKDGNIPEQEDIETPPQVSKIISVFLNPITSRYHPFFLELIEGMEHQSGILGLSISISSDLNKTRKQNSMLGAILVKRAPYAEILRLEKNQIPFVLLYEHCQTYGRGFPSVLIDDEDTIFKQTEYLIKLGHKKISLFTGILNGYLKGEGGRRRVKGYKRALQKHEIRFNPALIKECDYDEDTTRLMTEKLLLLSSPPTAIIGCDDVIAGLIINTLKEKNKKVPEDIAVVGIGNLRLSSMIYPPLTTFKIPVFEMGERAVSLLIRISNGEEAESPIYLKGEPLIRESCLCPYNSVTKNG